MGLYTQCRAHAAIIANALDKKKTLIAILLIAVYAVINGILLYFHEPWRDEAQVWLIARDLSFWKIPSLMRYEGHPCMWHWIIYPFVRMGLPYITLNLVSYVITLAATAFMIWKAPFPIWVKALFALSPCLTYFYPVIARSYCLIPPILFALAYFYPTRLTHPCRYTLFIALLVQTHVIMEMMALMLGLLLLIEYARDIHVTRNYRKGVHYVVALLIPLVSATFLLYMFWNVDSASAYHGVKRIGIGEIIDFLSHYKWTILAVVILVLILTAALKRTMAACAAAVIVIISLCFQTWFYICIYPVSTQRYIVTVLIIMWAFWIQQDTKNDRLTNGFLSSKHAIWTNRLCNIFLVIFFAISIKIYLLPQAKFDIAGAYSNSKDAARFINKNIPSNAILLADFQHASSAIIPHIEQKKMLYCPTMTEFSYVTFDKKDDIEISYEEFKHKMEVYDTSTVSVYLISTVGFSHVRDSLFSEDYELVYKSDGKAKYENFEIYKIH